MSKITSFATVLMIWKLMHKNVKYTTSDVWLLKVGVWTFNSGSLTCSSQSKYEFYGEKERGVAKIVGSNLTSYQHK